MPRAQVSTTARSSGPSSLQVIAPGLIVVDKGNGLHGTPVANGRSSINRACHTVKSATTRGEAVWRTFDVCPSLQESSRERDAVWLAVESAICTHGFARVTPMGSTSRVLVGADEATAELIAAMSWLTRHEDNARKLDPLNLFIALRGVATRGADGSARAAQADALHGMTNVPLGRMVYWRPIDETGVA
jgi:hypothetical protein